MLPRIKCVSLAFIYGLTLMTKRAVAKTTCKLKDDCSCILSTGKLIDLHGLKRLTTSYTSSTYIWEPCKSFDIGGLTDVSVVQHETIPVDVYNDFGVLKSTDFMVVDDVVVVTMASQDQTKQSLITCLCSQEKTEWTMLFTTGSAINFQLTSSYCCPRESSPDSKSLSIGYIVVITFVATLAVYMLFGVAFQMGVRKAQGMERIPHVTFWTALPGLIITGCKFTMSKTCGYRASYSEI